MKLHFLKLLSLIAFVVAVYVLTHLSISLGVLAFGCWLSTLWLHENPEVLTQDFNSKEFEGKATSKVGLIATLTIFTGVFLLMLEMLLEIKLTF